MGDTAKMLRQLSQQNTAINGTEEEKLAATAQINAAKAKKNAANAERLAAVHPPYAYPPAAPGIGMTVDGSSPGSGVKNDNSVDSLAFCSIVLSPEQQERKRKELTLVMRYKSGDEALRVCNAILKLPIQRTEVVPTSSFGATVYSVHVTGATGKPIMVFRSTSVGNCNAIVRMLDCMLVGIALEDYDEFKRAQEACDAFVRNLT